MLETRLKSSMTYLCNQLNRFCTYECVHMSRMRDRIVWGLPAVKFLAITDLTPDLSRDSRPHAVYTKSKSQCRSLFSPSTHTLQLCTPRGWHDQISASNLCTSMSQLARRPEAAGWLHCWHCLQSAYCFKSSCNSIRMPSSFFYAVCGVQC